MSEDTAEIKRKVERITAERAAVEDLYRLTVRRNLCWISAGFTFLAATFLSIGYWTGKIPLANGVISWLGPGLTGFAIMGGLAIQMTINQRRIGGKLDRLEEKMPDYETIGRLAAMHEATQAQLSQLYNEIASNERQRQADFDMIRENSRKALEAVHERLDKLLAGGTEQAERLALLNAEIGRLREGIDRIDGSLPEMVEEAIRKAHAAGYVAGVQQRLNGSGGTVVALQKP